jgi:hypothetical protein
VAASNLILTPEPFVAARKTAVLSSSSICQTFDADADGCGRAEGVNAVSLKPSQLPFGTVMISQRLYVAQASTRQYNDMDKNSTVTNTLF